MRALELPCTQQSRLEAVEFAALEWVGWWNNRRILEPIGDIPPPEKEADPQHTPAAEAGLT